MSPRPGGEADKFGYRYEGAWTVRHVLYVLLGRADSIIVEDIDELGEGSEFTLRRGDVVEVHQVKRQNGDANNWNAASLHSKGIWAKARQHVEAGRHYHFVSSIPARPLQELADRARRAGDLASFIKNWLTEGTRTPFDSLSDASIYGSTDATWDVLRKVWITWPDEHDVVAMNAVLAGLLLEGADGRLASVGLGDLVAHHLGVRLDAAQIESRLSEYGLSRSRAITSSAFVATVASVTTLWKTSLERELLKPVIAREETSALVERLEGDNPLVFLLGAAGDGKSAVLHETVAQLEASGASVLAFRLDRLEHFSSTSELGEHLGLPASPVASLAAVASSRPAVLVVDQLDAVSLVSGRIPHGFDAVAELVREAAAFNNMRVLMACRKFDVENDDRIRELVRDRRSSQIVVTELSDSQVADALQQMGLGANQLSLSQRELLRSPLHLVLLRGITDEPAAASFQTAHDLFEAFWRRKLRDCSRRRPEVKQFANAISTLAMAISVRQRLSVPDWVFDRDDIHAEADILASEHVFARSGSQVAFFHESFFDYAFARTWLERRQSLVEFLLEGEQELFRRGQVRQILDHLHELEPDRFVREAESLLVSSDIRFHIKDVALAVLRALSNPSSAEYEVLQRLLEMRPDFENRLWPIFQSTPWFTRLDTEEKLTEWLGGDDEQTQSRVLSIMATAVKEQPGRVAQLLAPHIDQASYPRWLLWVTRFADVHASRPLFDLLLTAVGSGRCDDAMQMVWLDVHGLHEHQPEWAIELLAAYLIDRPGAMVIDESGRVAALLDRDHSVIELARRSAEAAPKVFCERLLPYMLKVMEVTAYNNGSLPIQDHHFSSHYPDAEERPLHELEEALLFGARSALRGLTGYDVEAARPFLELLAASPYKAAQWLLYEAVQHQPAALAEWVGQLLLEGQHRYLSGYASNGVWTTRQLLQATTPHMSPTLYGDVERAILELRFSWEKQRPGWYQFNLLSGISTRRLSETGRRRLGELQRLFHMEQPPEPQGIEMGFVGAPIPREAAQHMNDEQWLKAITKHNMDREGWRDMIGGAREQASVLKDETVGDPARFARLALNFTSDTHAAYGDAVLQGLGDADALEDPTPAFEAIRHIGSLRLAANDRWLGWALRQYLKASIPEDLIKVIVDRALSAENPLDGELTVRISNNNRGRNEDIYNTGINTARGQSADILGDLLVYDIDGRRTAIVVPVLQQLANDPAVTVRSCVAHVIAACLRHARPQAIEAFHQLIDGDDILLATRHVRRLVGYIGNGDPSIVIPVIQRMLNSTEAETRKAGGELAAVAGLEWDKGKLLEVAAASTDPATRRGMAAACAQLLTNTSSPTAAADMLRRLVDDSDEEVREAAASVAMALRGERLGPFKKVISQLIASPSFDHALSQLLITLSRAPDRVDELVHQCAARFVAVHVENTGDIRTEAAADSREVGSLLVRGYAQATSVVIRRKTLDLLDQLLLVGAYGVAEIVRAAER